MYNRRLYIDDLWYPMSQQQLVPYGQGIFRRRIRLRRHPGLITGDLEDDIHAFSVRIAHDGEHIVDVTGTAHRYPMTTCPGAIAPLRQLVGAPLSPDSRSLGRHTDPRSHCTHWLDLAGLAVAHSQRENAVRQYDIAIPDTIAGATVATLAVDGVEGLALELDGDTIAAPAPFAGRAITAGFARWATDSLDGELREWALILQRGRFVSLSRAARSSQPPEGTTGPNRGQPLGVCHSYSEAVYPGADICAEMRDFTHYPDHLLAFIPTP